MYGPIRAVVVDDKPSHLFSISSGLTAAGIPCVPYWYDETEFNPDKKLKPSVDKEKNQFLRVIFTDLNLEEMDVNKGIATVISPAINVIRELVSDEGGPYILVFWTRAGFDIDEIRNELPARLVASGIPLPMAIDQLDKAKFLVNPPNEVKGEDALVKMFSEIYDEDRVSKLKEAIEAVLIKYGIILMFSEWESRAICAAGLSINGLFDVAEVENGASLEGVETAAKKIAALVAKQAVGKSASLYPAKSFDLAMQDMLVDSFSKSVNNLDYRKIVDSQLYDLLKNKVSVQNTEEVFSQLQTRFHLDTNVSDLKLTDRGVVIDLHDGAKAGLLTDVKSMCLWEDYFLKEDKDNKFTDVLRWLLVEVGADCDHAQGKERTFRYLAAAKVPAEYKNEFVFSKSKQKLKNDSLELLGPYNDEGGKFFLLVSLKRFIAWQKPDTELPEIKILYRFRQSIVNYLLNKYAVWSMRPGIVEYKP